MEIKRKEILSRIENMTLILVKSLVLKDPPKFVIRNLRKWSNCNFSDKLITKPLKNAVTCQIKFQLKHSRKNFAIIIYLLAKIYKMQIDGSTNTRRELYYENVELMESQKRVDSAMGIISSLLETPSWNLGVYATSKGLIAGSLTLKTNTGEVMRCSSARGTSIPQNISTLKPYSNAQFILIVEKDAIFQKLLDEQFLNYFDPVIILTSKGFPDVSTRLLIKLLWETLTIPIYALVDADPHGIEIMCTYRYGSLKLAEEAEWLAVPSIQWLGIHPSDIQTFKIPTIPFSRSDEKKIESLAARPYTLCNQKLLKEVNTLKIIKRKAEIEEVSKIAPDYLTKVFIPLKIKMKDFI